MTCHSANDGDNWGSAFAVFDNSVSDNDDDNDDDDDLIFSIVYPASWKWESCLFRKLTIKLSIVLQHAMKRRFMMVLARGIIEPSKTWKK